MIKEIDLIVYDFDGVMTDNRVLVFEDGKEAVFVNRSDGLAVKSIKALGIRQIIISAETNTIVSKRAEKLGVLCIQCVDDKKKELKAYCAANKINLDSVIYVGNDINDLEAMECVGWPVCPSDASDSIKKLSRIVTGTKGGNGVIRELLDILTKDLQS